MYDPDNMDKSTASETEYVSSKSLRVYFILRVGTLCLTCYCYTLALFDKESSKSCESSRRRKLVVFRPPSLEALSESLGSIIWRWSKVLFR